MKFPRLVADYLGPLSGEGIGGCRGLSSARVWCKIGAESKCDQFLIKNLLLERAFCRELTPYRTIAPKRDSVLEHGVHG